MGDPSGFLEIARILPDRRPVSERLKDWKEVYRNFPDTDLQKQAARCMDCGIPFCQKGCPIGNIIPDWNDLIYRDNWREAIERLSATNNFPEFTGRLCPAPCEGSCVLGINDDAVTIKQIEVTIVERAFDEGWIVATPPTGRTGKKVAVVGSGPAGLAAADLLNRVGHSVTVLERDDRIGGLLRYGIPEFKMETRILDRRLDLLAAEGVRFQTNANVGVNIKPDSLRDDFDAILLAGGATAPRDLPVPGRDLDGIHFAMEYLPMQNKRCEGDVIAEDAFISAEGKRVVIIGGGDTGADCLGTAHRQGAALIHQFELLDRPPDFRAENNPWPNWPNIFRTSSAHEEGGDRRFNVSTKSFTGSDGKVQKLHGVKVRIERSEGGRFNIEELPDSEFELEVDLVFLAMGFLGPEKEGMLGQLGVDLNNRGNVGTDFDKMTNVGGVFAAGDMVRGQSLIVWAIHEGREAARGMDKYLMGSTEIPSFNI